MSALSHFCHAVDVCHQQGSIEDAADHQPHCSADSQHQVQEPSAGKPPTQVHWRLQEG